MGYLIMRDVLSSITLDITIHNELVNENADIKLNE